MVTDDVQLKKQQLTEEIEKLKAELKETTLLAEERLNRLKYLQSDFDNYRKWSEKEKGAIIALANENLIKIPSGTQSHTLFQLREQGMPYLNSDNRGDLLVKAVVRIPEKLSKKQEELVKEAFASEK